ncbi:MAG: O-antigen ligase family protein [Chloroflexi bacterium]|nr:O-antigen ligase family protein [Chloroflexota bacterium]
MQPYITTLKKFWLVLIIPVVVLPLILALILNPNPTYTASIGLWFDQPIYLDTTQTSTATSDLTTGTVNNYADSLTSLLNSHDFLVEVTNELTKNGYSLSENARTTLLLQINKGAKLTVAGNNFLVVSYASDNANLAVSILRALTTSYTNYIEHAFLTNGQSMITFVQNQLNQAKTDLDKAQQDALAYLANHPSQSKPSITQSFVSDTDVQRDLLLLTRDQAQTRYNTLSSNLEQLKMAYDKVSKGNSNLIEIRDPAAIVKSDVFNKQTKIIVGSILGLAGGLLTSLLLVLLLTWNNTSLFASSQTSRLLGLQIISELPFTRALEKKKQNYPARSYKLRLLRRNILILLASIGFLGITLFLSYKNPPNAIVTPVVILLIVLIYKNPAIGFNLTVFLVLACEIYISPDGFSDYTTIPVRNYNSFTSLSLSFTPVETILAWTIFCIILRTIRSNKFTLKPKATTALFLIFGGFLAFAYVWGVILHHGDSKAALVEIRAPIYLVLVYLLTTHFMPNRKIWVVLDWIIPAGLSLLALTTLIRYFLLAGTSEAFLADSLSGFNHDNAILFVILVMWCLNKVVFGSSKGQRLTGFLLVILPVVAIMLSGRRAAFASLGICLIAFLMILFIKRRKAFFITVVILLIIVPPYMILFKNASGPLGLAARAFNSSSAAVGSRDYSSDLYRVIEKNNVRLTIREAPLTGKGFGQQFTRYNSLVDLNFFEFQYYTPHVQVLWLWLKVGVFGWILFWVLICGALFRLGQLVKYERQKLYLNLAITAGNIIIAIMVFAYLDISLVNTRLMTILGVSIGLLEIGYRNLNKRNVITNKTNRLDSSDSKSLDYLEEKELAGSY